MTVAVEVFMPCARDIWRLAPVARRALPLSVLKYHQSMATITAVTGIMTTMGLFSRCSPQSRTYRLESMRSYLSTLTASVA